MPRTKKVEKVEKDSQAIEPVPAPLGVTPVESLIVAPAVTPEQALAAWNAYQDLVKKLLNGSDYQVIYLSENRNGQWMKVKKPFKKKSAWRKLATAFNISVEIVKEERKTYFAGTPKEYFVHEATAKAVALNGRYMVGTGSCASNERGFAHLEHDVRAQAETRAKNRAIADLIGGGEVSAEEMEGVATQDSARQEVNQSSCDVDHETLPTLFVKKEGKNHGRPYKVCQRCKWWRWMDLEKKEEVKKDTTQGLDDQEESS